MTCILISLSMKDQNPFNKNRKQTRFPTPNWLILGWIHKIIVISVLNYTRIESKCRSKLRSSEHPSCVRKSIHRYETETQVTRYEELNNDRIRQYPKLFLLQNSKTCFCKYITWEKNEPFKKNNQKIWITLNSSPLYIYIKKKKKIKLKLNK